MSNREIGQRLYLSHRTIESPRIRAAGRPRPSEAVGVQPPRSRAGGGVLFREQVRGFGRADPLVMNERLDCFQLGGRWVEVPVAGLFALRG